MTLVIVLHGVESTGKSVLAERLAHHFGEPWVAEYGRAYAEKHGVVMDEADLRLIGRTQAGMIAAAKAKARRLLFADTDSLITAAWAEMMIGHVPTDLMTYPKADLYLMMEPDVPWVPDAVRLYGDMAARTRFDGLCRDVLSRAAVRTARISGDWDARFMTATAAVRALTMEKLGFDLNAETG